MLSLRSLAGFQKETLLGLLAVALMLAGVSAAANWALWEAGDYLRESKRAELTTLSLDIAGQLERASLNHQPLSAALTRGVAYSARVLRSDLSVVPLGRIAPPPLNDAPSLERVRSLIRSDSSLFYQFSYYREHRSDWEQFHCPVYLGNEWRMLVVTRTTPLLAKLERVSLLLAGVGAALLALLVVVIVALYKAISRPYERIQLRVEAVAMPGERPQLSERSQDAESAVERLVEEYRRTILELERKEAKLIELNEQLADRVTDVERINRYLLSSMTTGVVLLDRAGNVAGINSLAAQRIGCDEGVGSEQPEDYVGLFAELPEVKRRVESALVEPVSDEFDVALTEENGDMRILRFSMFPLCEEDGGLRELALFVADHTQIALARRRLEDSRRLQTLGEMAAGLAHQLRNSISAALGFGALARKRAGASEKALEPINSLLQELQEEAALVDRFLSFARPLSLMREETDVGEWLGNIIDGYEAQAETRGRISLELSPEIYGFTLEIDSLLLKQAVVNLIDNAIRAGSDSPDKVRVSASAQSDSVVIAVSDSGPGVSEKDRERIFTPFYSGSPSGAGLGLPLARKIVDLHGGSLELDSGEQRGATFRISLPLKPEPVEPETSENAPATEH